MKVLVAGAGIGGLALAQGLTRAGIAVEVIERDADVSATRGYKLHLGPPAVAALRELLTPTGVERLLASSVATTGFALALRDHRGRHLLTAREPASSLSLDVDRATLRHVLAADLGDAVRWGTTATGFARTADGVEVRMADGGAVGGDLLVIADGAGSRLAEQLAGAPTARPTGLVGIAGLTQWTRLPSASRALLDGAPVLALGPDGTGLFATAHDPVSDAALDSPLAMPATRDPIAIWGLIALADRMPGGVLRASPEQLVSAATARLRRSGWAERLIDVVARTRVADVAAYPLLASDPDRLAPWRTGPMTALGDAVHAMPPTGGQGAATAILDAADLVRQLRRVSAGETTTVVGVHDFERTMRSRGRVAVAESVQPLAWIRAGATPLGSRAFRALTPVVASAHAVERAVRGRLTE